MKIFCVGNGFGRKVFWGGFVEGEFLDEISCVSLPEERLEGELAGGSLLEGGGDGWRLGKRLVGCEGWLEGQKKERIRSRG